MSRRQLIWLISAISLLVGGIVLCIIRWQAWFVNPLPPKWNGDSVSVVFEMPDTLTQSTTRMLVLGDVHSMLSHDDWVRLDQHCPPLTCYAQVGDLLERGNQYYWYKHVHELQNTRFMSLPLMLCPGNHEYQKGIVRRLPTWWTDRFRMPTNGPIDYVGTTFYADFPQMRCIVINTAGLVRLRDYVRSYTWVKRAIQTTSDDRFVVVMMHHPVHSAAKGRFNLGEYLCFSHLLRSADVVFTGHDHIYMRRMPYIGLISVPRFRATKKELTAEKIIENEAVYAIVTVKQRTMKIRVYRMSDCSLVDEMVLSKDAL